MQSSTKMLFVLLALAGLIAMVAGVLLPVVKCDDIECYYTAGVLVYFSEPDSDDVEISGSLFNSEAFEDFDDVDQALRYGLNVNQYGVFLLIIAVLSLIPALTLRGLGAMSIVALVYISLVFYVFMDLDEIDPSYAWVGLYGGAGLMFVAWLLHTLVSMGGASAHQPSAYGGYYQQPYQQPYGQPPGQSNRPPWQ